MNSPAGPGDCELAMGLKGRVPRSLRWECGLCVCFRGTGVEVMMKKSASWISSC